jgi:integrase
VGAVRAHRGGVPDPPRVPERPPSLITSEQARAILAAVCGDRLESLYTVALALGLRQEEALGLHWEDIDLEVVTLTVTGALQRVKGTLQRGEPKTARSWRTLPLPLVDRVAGQSLVETSTK